MRFLITGLLFVSAMLALLFGVAQKTIWAPATSFKLAIDLHNAAPYVVIPSSTLARFPVDPTVTVYGEKQVFASVGRESDIAAWIGSCQHIQVELAANGKKLAENLVSGAGVLSDPSGSDLWRDERSGTKQLSMTVANKYQPAILIASNGINAAPKKLNLEWQFSNDQSLANISLILGGALFLAALIMNWISYWHIRKTRGPRRRTPKPPRGPQLRRLKVERAAPTRGRRVAGRDKLAVPAGILILGLLTGCSNTGSTPLASPTPTSSALDATPTASLQEVQLNRILNDVAISAASGDKNKDAKLLQNRFNGPALEVRAAHYLMQQRSKKLAAMAPIAAGPISFNLPAATTTWPRTVMAVTARAGSSDLPQMLVLQQDSPRSNYKVWFTIAMLPGAKIPDVAASDVGAIPVDQNSLFLKLPPKNLPKSYGDVIDRGLLSPSAPLFDVAKDQFYIQLSQGQASQLKNLKKASLKFTHSLGSSNVLSLATADAGALVAVFTHDTYTIKPTKAGSAVTVSGNEKIMLGSNGSVRGVRSVYGDMMLFYVPALTTKHQIKLLGVTQGLVSVRGL